MKLFFTLLSVLFSVVLMGQGTFSVESNRVTFHKWNKPTKYLKVFLVEEIHEKKDSIVVAGKFITKGEDFIFIPDFPLLDHITYTLVSDSDSHIFSLKAKTNIAPVVTQIYPTATELPENLLRMYIQFSKPMKTVGNLENIKLVDENGMQIKGAIFNNVYELWDATQTQLTIIFDPSRVKTGLIANETLGRALQAGENVRLVVDHLQDIYGQPMEHPYTKRFTVVKEDVIAPDTDLWEMELPTSNENAAFKLHFVDAIDEMSLLNRIKMYTDSGEVLKGMIHLKNEERTWEFIPEENWMPGKYLIKVNTRLADPSGNNLNGLFDHKIGGLKNEKEGTVITIPFHIE